MRLARTVLLAGVMASLATAGALAAGGGGSSGGGEMPSASGPAYDPAKEYEKAVKALEAKDYKNAARAAQHVTEAAPKAIDGWRMLGMASSGAQNWKQAKRAYERAVKIDPNDPMSHAGLGVALAKLQDAKAQAELDWLKAKVDACGTSCPADLKAAQGQVESAVSEGAAPKPAAALDAGSLLFAGAKAGDAAYVQAVGLINEKRYDEALKSLADARAILGPHPDILTYQGYTWRKKGDWARAEDYYKQALAIAPDHRGATEYYGELKVERGDMAGAKLMLAKLDKACAFGCAEAEELRRWIDAGGEPRS